MSYASLLINTCTVQRNTPGVATPYGTPAEGWADVPALTNIACRLQAVTGKEVMIGAEVVIADYLLFLQDVGITEQDRVLIGTETYEILLVEDKQDDAIVHHKECLLRAVR